MREAEFEYILQQGEGYLIEFKESLNSGVTKEMAAFANGSGGRIFIGITDKKEVVGISTSHNTKEQIHSYARECDPPIEINVGAYRNVLIITVKEGYSKPYRCSTGFYLRQGPVSQKLRTREIQEFFQHEGRVRFDEFVRKEFDFKKTYNPEKLEHFLKLAEISKTLTDKEILKSIKAIDAEHTEPVWTNAGLMFFSKKLEDVMLHAVVTCVLYKGTEKVDIIDKKDFGSDLITDIESAMSFLKQHLRVRYEIKDTARRKEIPEIPYSALREAVVNAVCHRDYFEKGARVTIEVFDDRVVITNPGGLPKGLDPSDFGTISLARNPNIAGILHRADYIERIGTGINRMKIAVAKAGLVKPEITHSNFFRITFSRKFLEQYEAISETVNEIANETVKKATNETVNETVNEIANETVKNSKKHHPISSKTEQNKDEKSVIISANETVNKTMNETVNETVKKAMNETVNETGDETVNSPEIAHLIDILLFIARKEGATTSQLMKKFGVSRTTIYRNVKSLSDIGLVAFIGPPKTGKYQLTINGKKKLAALAQGLDSI